MPQSPSVRRIIWFAAGVFIAVVLFSQGSNRLTANPPNVLWIISDDLGPELGCYGYPDVATPNLDRLAATGRLYTHAFATSPVCSSSRSAFQTGQYQTSIGCHHHLTRQRKELPASVPTAIGLMRKAGLLHFPRPGSCRGQDRREIRCQLPLRQENHLRWKRLEPARSGAALLRSSAYRSTAPQVCEEQKSAS